MMNSKFAIIVNLYVVPLVAVLLGLNSVRVGTGMLILDMVVYFISLFLCYSITYFFLNFYTKRIEKLLSISIYILLITTYSIAINYFLIVPLTLLFFHLLYKTKESETEINLDKSILSFVIKSLPVINKKALIAYVIISVLIILLTLALSQYS